MNIVTFAYRGYSNSDGSPSEDGLKKDADAIINYVKTERKIDKSQLFLMGRSLGGAVSIYTAHRYPNLFSGVVIENTFSSMPDMVDKLFPFVGLFKDYILKNNWPSKDLVTDINYPMLFVTGDKDEIVPHE